MEAFLGQPRDIISPAGHTQNANLCPAHFSREASRGHPDQMPKPPQLAPLDVEEQRFCTESLPVD